MEPQNQAKQELAAKGISYNEVSFLTHVSDGDIDVVKLFLDAGIRPSARNRKGETALIVASKKGHQQIAKILIEAGAHLDELVESYHNKAKQKKKDIWDKISALSSIATVFASVLIAAIGWYFTYSYNQRQIDQNNTQNNRDAAFKEQQNRILEMDIMEKMIPHLTKDEESKRVALITIRNLARPDLATQMAQLYPSEGSVLALKQFASSTNPDEKKQAVAALSNIAISGGDEAKASALGALGSIFDNFKSAVVKINAISQSGQQTVVTGTGIMVTSSGHILTTKQIVDPPRSEKLSYVVEMWDGSKHEATLQDMDPASNLALLKVEGVNFRKLEFADNIPTANTRVVAIGAILGGPLKPAVGTVRSVSDQFLEIQFDTPGIMPGLSGGPILDASGMAVGISFSFSPPLREFIRSDNAKKYLRSKGIEV